MFADMQFRCQAAQVMLEHERQVVIRVCEKAREIRNSQVGADVHRPEKQSISDRATRPFDRSNDGDIANDDETDTKDSRQK